LTRLVVLIAIVAVAALVTAVPAFTAGTAPALPQFAKGPFTIRGQIHGVDGKPVGAGIPVAVFPMLPNPGMDLYNLVYKIPGYQDHLTYTDAEGKFEVKGVIRYPEVKHGIFRLWAAYDGYGEWADRAPFLKACTKIDLANQLQNELWVDLEAEPAGALRIIATNKDGTPFTGTKAISIGSGYFLETFTAEFKNGVYVRPGVALPNPDMPWSRIILFDDAHASITMKRALDAGKPIDMTRVIDDGPAILDVMTTFKQNEFTTIRVMMP
jgi:hypothetical protein